VTDAGRAGHRHPDHAYLGQLKPNTSAVMALAKARWLPGDLRAVFAGWLRIDAAYPTGLAVGIISARDTGSWVLLRHRTCQRWAGPSSPHRSQRRHDMPALALTLALNKGPSEYWARWRNP
jgi:hypothetical protein